MFIIACVRHTKAPTLSSMAAGSLALCLDVNGDYGLEVDGEVIKKSWNGEKKPLS